MIKGILIYLAMMNLISAYLMYRDKQKAKKGGWRVPESSLLLTCLAGGFLGTCWGMYAIRHKTKHWYFYAITFFSAALWNIGIPAFILNLSYL